LARAAVAVVLATGVGGPGSASAADDPATVALDYVERHKQAFGLTGSDVKELAVSSVVSSRHNGVTHVYLQQRHRGIDVHTGVFTVNVGRDGAVLSAGSRFVPHLAAAAEGKSALRAATQAAEAAARHLNLRPTRAFEPLFTAFAADDAVTLSDGGIAAGPIEARLVWLPTEAGVRLAWRLEIEEAAADHWWMAFVDAGTGEALLAEDLVIQDSVDAIADAIARPASGEPAPLSFPETDGAAYRVFALPFESPSDGDRTLVTGAADPSASPFGWHDVDGAPGAEFTVTRGNNVHAYTDLDANNVADPGSDPDGGPGLSFDFPLDLTQTPDTYRPAAVTNLFYWNNVMHDVTHRYGFDEAAGNFQVNTYGNGGLGNDDVRAEAQDGSGTNNANFGTPVDGLRPRMQMFIWTHPRPNTVSVASGGAAGNYEASRAVFGPQLAATGPVSGAVALVNDTGGVSVTDGCEALVGFPAGAIALLDRGNCTFVAKVVNAQAAGAVAVIVANNVPGNPITMGFTPPIPPVLIPSVMVSLDDGNLLKANLPLSATLAVDPTRGINRDSDLDAGVIAHEYGHGISNRLTGGPAVVNCLNNAEQMGEGWSDWFGITLTASASDTPTTPRGVGTYVIYQPADGDGIRPTPYTTDLAVNPSTYASVADTANISQPHGIGYVWNSMLWEVYWNLVDRYGFNPNIYDPWSSGGNNLAFQLVIDGMKFQPCRPGFVDGRNAILTADVALTGGLNQCEVWRGFAKRGLGASASQGLATSRLDGVEAFDLPASCTSAVFGGFQPPVENPPAVNRVNAGSTVPVKFTLSGGGSSPFIDSQPVDCETLVPTGEAPQPIASPGGSDLKRKGDSYHVNWKTDRGWEGSCRRLTIRIPAASDAVAFFEFH
jgi:hypothetical protein